MYVYVCVCVCACVYVFACACVCLCVRLLFPCISLSLTLSLLLSLPARYIRECGAFGPNLAPPSPAWHPSQEQLAITSAKKEAFRAQAQRLPGLGEGERRGDVGRSPSNFSRGPTWGRNQRGR